MYVLATQTKYRTHVGHPEDLVRGPGLLQTASPDLVLRNPASLLRMSRNGGFQAKHIPPSIAWRFRTHLLLLLNCLPVCCFASAPTAPTTERLIEASTNVLIALYMLMEGVLQTAIYPDQDKTLYT
ncbi:hypothetical protein Y032_0038g3584 [Ancylostoma ceylanicum]|uniref:Uncharacterized protein n=1 Tax=Ancylostoma ceylanicum TaxID=53326 RepID=A0A016UKK9_9BILA|nr:hypothetical protein Y032_0038g3584 [Ancylostoma ceylanicum]